jgi:site-specific DNA-methyltransferase (adenine-specific)
MSAPRYQDDAVEVWHGDCLDVLRQLSDDSVDAVVTDPPYGLAELKPATVGQALAAWLAGDRDHVPDGRGFMGRAWDGFVPPPAVWDECLRVLKPGGHLLAFAGSRTADLMGVSVRLAGFEIRDTITWHYASGMPKSLDVSKAIDKAAGAEREVIGINEDYLRRKPNGMKTAGASTYGYSKNDLPTDARITAPATDAARQWSGWGTALKPASEPIIVARKPLAGTVAQTVLAYGTGAMNIGACRVGAEPRTNNAGGASSVQRVSRVEQGYRDTVTASVGEASTVTGRWPSNVVFSHAPLLDADGDVIGDACAEGCIEGCPVAELDAQSGILKSGANPTRRGSDKFRDSYGEFKGQAECTPARDADSGYASRFFPTFRYQAKAGTDERPRLAGTAHPTVKPLPLMAWLVRLVTPPGGLVLDPFAGSGTTGEACLMEGFRCTLIEQDATYLPLIIDRVTKHRDVVAHLQHRRDHGEPEDLGLFALLPEVTA